jgi:hypothetical protein
MSPPESSHEQPTASWVPTRSIVGGNSIGAFIAVLVLPFILPLYPQGIDHDSITVAFSGICTFICCYFIPDRKN